MQSELFADIGVHAGLLHPVYGHPGGDMVGDHHRHEGVGRHQRPHHGRHNGLRQDRAGRLEVQTVDVHRRDRAHGDGRVGVPAFPGRRLVGESHPLRGDVSVVGCLLHAHERAVRLSFGGDNRRPHREDFAFDVAFHRRSRRRSGQYAAPPPALRQRGEPDGRHPGVGGARDGRGRVRRLYPVHKDDDGARHSSSGKAREDQLFEDPERLSDQQTAARAVFGFVCLDSVLHVQHPDVQVAVPDTLPKHGHDHPLHDHILCPHGVLPAVHVQDRGEVRQKGFGRDALPFEHRCVRRPDVRPHPRQCHGHGDLYGRADVHPDGRWDVQPHHVGNGQRLHRLPAIEDGYARRGFRLRHVQPVQEDSARRVALPAPPLYAGGRLRSAGGPDRQPGVRRPRRHGQDEHRTHPYGRGGDVRVLHAHLQPRQERGRRNAGAAQQNG